MALSAGVIPPTEFVFSNDNRLKFIISLRAFNGRRENNTYGDSDGSSRFLIRHIYFKTKQGIER